MILVMWLQMILVWKNYKSQIKKIGKSINEQYIYMWPYRFMDGYWYCFTKNNTEKQSQNNHKIREEIEKLLSYIGTIVDKGNKLERGLNSANSAWVDFKKSFNSRFIVSAKRV